MDGPKPKGFWTKHDLEPKLRNLVAGNRYRVIQAFDDWNRVTHPVGEEWVFLGSSFLPHDDGRSVFVTLDGEREWRIPLQSIPEEQQEIAYNLQDYVAFAEPLGDEELDALKAELEAFDERPAAPEDPDWVRELLRLMFEIDQRHRNLYLEAASRGDEARLNKIGPAIVEADRQHRRRLDAWLSDHGWPTPESHGKDACDQAWLIAIHADFEPDFMKRVLSEMEALRETDQVDPVHYASLLDRIAIVERRPQRYGMFYRLEDGEHVPYPIEDPEGLAHRRAELGLDDETFHR